LGEEKFVFPEKPQIWSPGRPLNLFHKIVSQTTSYIMSFNFLR